MTVELHEMDCRLAMAMLMDAESVDSVVCDPPYGLSKEPDMAEVLRHWLDGDDYVHKSAGFMSAVWDSFVPGPSVWREAYRVLKPGGHLVAFFGTRTYDLGVLAIRLAGFEIRDQTAWLFGSGFPKSHDVSKGIDRAAGAERAVIGANPNHRAVSGVQYEGTYAGGNTGAAELTAPATPEAAQWQGWGTALKPAMEPIVIARKPLIGTVAANVLAHGTGAINIDGCRVGTEARVNPPAANKAGGNSLNMSAAGMPADAEAREAVGRWPANIVHDGSDAVVALFPDSKGLLADASMSDTPRNGQHIFGAMRRGRGVEPSANSQNEGAVGFKMRPGARRGDEGSAARFFANCPYDETDDCHPFYHPKASKSDRNYGLDDHPEQPTAASQFRPNHAAGAERGEDGNPYGRWTPTRNIHPTVKPTPLMQWLCRLVTPPGGTVLDPFMGSGSTGIAAVREGFSFIGCEMTPEYMAIAKARIDHAVKNA